MAPAGLVWAPQGVSSLSEGRDTAEKCSSCLFSEHLVLSGLAEVFFIKRLCDAQALIAKERGVLGGQGRQSFSLVLLWVGSWQSVVSLVLGRQVGSCGATLERALSLWQWQKAVLLVAAFGVRIIVRGYLVA